MGSGFGLLLVGVAGLFFSLSVACVIVLSRAMSDQARLIRDMADRLSAKEGVVPITSGNMPAYMSWSPPTNDDGTYDPVHVSDEDIADAEAMAARQAWSTGGYEPPR